MDREQGDEGALVNGAVTREVGEGEELAPEPGTVGELVHFNGSATRIDGGGRCVLIQVMGFHGEPAVVVRLHEGRSWHRAVPGAGGSGTYELRLSEAVVTAHDATFAAVRGTGGGCVLAVLQGRVEVSSSSALDGVAVGALEAVALSAHGQVGRVRALTPAEIAADAWLEVNRLFDGDAGSGPVHPPAPGPERRPARSPRTRPAVRHGPPSGTRPSSASTRRERERPTPAAASAGEPTAETVSPGFRAGPETPTSLAVAEPVTVAPPDAVEERRRAVAPAPRAPGRHRGQRLARRRVGAALVVVMAGGTLAVAYHQPTTMLLTVNGRQVRVARSNPTVATALEAAGVAPKDGTLFSAGTHTPLDRHFTPARLSVNGIPATRKTRVSAGARIDAAPGRDVVEATAQRQAPTPPPPLPPVEHSLWYPGTSGREDQVYGTVSGEVLSRRPLVEPVPPRREEGNIVALTFDDGPHPVWTPQVLEILRSEGVKATFCVVGSMGKKHVDLVQAVREAGHVLCNHTENHAEKLDTASSEKVVDEIDGGFRFLESAVGTPPPLYRPPGGHVGPKVIEVAQRKGMRVLNWTVAPRDHEKAPADVILARTLEAVRPGAVILLHDGGGDRAQTVAMLRPLIQQLKGRGFGFATPLGPPAPPG